MAILTQDEYEKLKKEFDHLNGIERPRVARDLKEAIAQGDLSENAAYSDAKERQSEIESRIKEIKNKLAISEIVEHGKSSENINTGATFRARDEDSGEVRTFSIVGPGVSSPQDGKISFDSPLGKEFLNKRQGELVEVATPGGKRRYTVLEILRY
ncbi:MAG: transcription elongation factor GreA [Candidatus Spechtbacterales bacterium]